MTQKRNYQPISDRDNWTLPFFKTSSGFCPFYSPSIFESGAALAHGLDLKQERKYRIIIIKYMFECGNGLQLPYNTICIAMIYFHKFFASISIRAHDPYFISTSCLFTAGKQEETRIRLDQCARFLYEYKLRQRCKEQHTPFNYISPSKQEIERICKKLAIAELLCTQINKFNYNINLPFDYLLPIISQWKSVYIPHQTNMKTLKYVYCLNAFKFIKQSFYIPINIIIPPQKLGIVCMELSLRLNYEKYRQQQEALTHTHRHNGAVHNDNEYRYIDPPLQWFRIFHVNENEQDLKDEIHLLCNEILNAVQDVHEFGTRKDLERCKNWRKNTLKMDSVHKEIIEQLNTIHGDNDGYPFNIAEQLQAKDVLSNNNKGNKVLQHRYQIQKEVEMSLGYNNAAVSPASLEPHKYLSLYPLKEPCFEDVDREYEEELKRKEKEKALAKQSQSDAAIKHSNHKRSRRLSTSRDKKKKYRKKSHESSSDDEDEDEDDDEEEEEEDEEDEEDDDIEIKQDTDHDAEFEEEKKSNAIKAKKTKRRENKKRKRSESTEHEHDRDKEKKENQRKKRRIVRSGDRSNRNKSKHMSEDDDSSDSDDNHRTSRKDRKSRKRSQQSSSSKTRSSSSGSPNLRSRNRERDRDRERDKERIRNRKKRKSASPIDNEKRIKVKKGKKTKKENKNNTCNKQYTNKPVRERDRDRDIKRDRYKNKNKRNNNKNRNKRHRYVGGYFTPHPFKALNTFECHAYYEDRNHPQVFDENAHFDYGLTPMRNDRNNKMDVERDDHESGECTDDHLRQIMHSTAEFNEEKTQRNEPPDSPMLKVMKSANKSQLYNNMLIPSRKDK